MSRPTFRPRTFIHYPDLSPTDECGGGIREYAMPTMVTAPRTLLESGACDAVESQSCCQVYRGQIYLAERSPSLSRWLKILSVYRASRNFPTGNLEDPFDRTAMDAYVERRAPLATMMKEAGPSVGGPLERRGSGEGNDVRTGVLRGFQWKSILTLLSKSGTRPYR